MRVILSKLCHKAVTVEHETLQKHSDFYRGTSLLWFNDSRDAFTKAGSSVLKYIMIELYKTFADSTFQGLIYFKICERGLNLICMSFPSVSIEARRFFWETIRCNKFGSTVKCVQSVFFPVVRISLKIRHEFQIQWNKQTIFKIASGVDH